MTAVTAGRLGLGILGVGLPRLACRLWGADPRSAVAVTTARILGARHAGQALLLRAHPTPNARRVSVAVDLVHGASMLALAAASPTWRRPALTSAAIATMLALGTRLHPDAATLPDPGARLRHPQDSPRPT